MPKYIAVVVTLFALFMDVAAAGETATVKPSASFSVPESDASKWRLGAAFGFGIRSNPLIQSDDIPVVVDLDIAWFGERLFFDNGDIGVAVSDNEWFTLSVVGRFNSDRVFFGKTSTRFVQVGTGASSSVVEVVVPDRDYAVEAGAELLTGGNWGRLQLTAYHDVGSTHGGYALGADYSFGIRQQRFYLEPSIGVTVKSRKLNDYYWSVRADEASRALPEYRADSGTNLSMRILGSYQITQNWTFAMVAEYERLNGEAAASPLVRDDHVTGFFAGFGYRF